MSSRASLSVDVMLNEGGPESGPPSFSISWSMSTRHGKTRPFAAAKRWTCVLCTPQPPTPRAQGVACAPVTASLRTLHRLCLTNVAFDILDQMEYSLKIACFSARSPRPAALLLAACQQRRTWRSTLYNSSRKGSREQPGTHHHDCPTPGSRPRPASHLVHAADRRAVGRAIWPSAARRWSRDRQRYPDDARRRQSRL